MPNNMHEILLNYFDNDISVFLLDRNIDTVLDSIQLQIYITADYMEIILKYTSGCKQWMLFRDSGKLGDRLKLTITEIDNMLELKEYNNSYNIAFNNSGKLKELSDILRYFNYFEGRVTSVKF